MSGRTFDWPSRPKLVDNRRRKHGTAYIAPTRFNRAVIRSTPDAKYTLRSHSNRITPRPGTLAVSFQPIRGSPKHEQLGESVAYRQGFN